MNPQQKTPNQTGFSLIEMILVVFVVIAIGALVANLPSSLKLVGSQKKESIAKDIASKKVEDLRSQAFVNLINGTTPIIDSRLSGLPSGAGNITVSDCPATVGKNSEINIKQVDVDVTWVESGTNKNVKVTTLITQGGLQ